ncbi:enediyne antibiotic chromoprotein [Streptosporangium sp. CA-135522]|uniref:enediyne antibiotic chromoprotein n=1 Tax=Streptosporangium sp. CA-135522 TaxID=3240072 RepID=UPI003D8FF432
MMKALSNKGTMLSKIGVAAALALGLATAFQSAAGAAVPAAASAAAVSLTPSTNLADGDTVAVSATGLSPNTVYHVGQCAFVQSGAIACNQPQSVDVTTDANGAATTSIVVRRTFQGLAGSEGTPAGTVDCAAVACSIGLGTSAGQGAGAGISFK